MDLDARKLMVLLVFKLAEQRRISRLERNEESGSDHLFSQPELQDDCSTMHGISLSDIVVEVAALCSVGNKTLGKWVRQYVDSGSGAISSPRVRKHVVPPQINSTKNVSKSYILEGIALMKKRHSKGLFTNYSVLMSHFKSEDRVHPFTNLVNCPPVQFSKRVLSHAFYRCTGIGWAEVVKKGKKGGTPEKEDCTTGNLYVFLCNTPNCCAVKSLERLSLFTETNHFVTRCTTETFPCVAWILWGI